MPNRFSVYIIYAFGLPWLAKTGVELSKGRLFREMASFLRKEWLSIAEVAPVLCYSFDFQVGDIALKI